MFSELVAKRMAALEPEIADVATRCVNKALADRNVDFMAAVANGQATKPSSWPMAMKLMPTAMATATGNKNQPNVGAAAFSSSWASVAADGVLARLVSTRGRE